MSETDAARDSAPAPERRDGLSVPVFYGDGAATEFLTGIAAPLLAAAAIAITGVVVQQPDSLRLPGLTLLLLIAAASLLIASVQFGFLARRHMSTPDQVSAWWPELDTESRKDRVRRDIEDDAPLLAWWSDFARWSYGLGIVLLWSGLGAAVLPDDGDEQAGLRWAAAILGWIVALLELIWLVLSRTKPMWFTPRKFERRHYERG